MRVIRTAVFLILLGASLCCCAPAAVAEQPPNVVLILVDDLGFTDLGAYGSEIATPNIDALANQGILFTNYHTSPMCAPSRAMLMTGLDSHQTGLANLPETVPEEHAGQPGYTGTLEPQATTIATRLKELGYRTYMTGKWHLGHTPESLPSARGFDRTFILDATGGDNWEKRAYMPVYETADWFENGQPTDLPQDFYSSEFLVDRMIAYIDSDPATPFFSYLAFLAVHIPVQAPREFSDHYRGRYDEGWEALRHSRQRGAVAKGVIPADAPVGPMLHQLRKWDELPADERALLAARMEVYAGMVEAMDFHVGRLIRHLKDAGRFDNTVFIVTSDNGPEAADPIAAVPSTRWWLRGTGYRLEGDDLGERGTWTYIGPEFASAAVGPLSYFKFHAGEGGVRVPMLFAGPRISAGQHDGFSFVTDVAPTILEIAGGTPDAEPTLAGRSLVPVVSGRASRSYDADSEIGFEAAGQSGLYRGDYKLVRNWLPYGDRTWRLYNMAVDPGETRDLSGTLPDLFASMQSAYRLYSERNGVLEVAADYDPIANLEARSIRILVWRHGPSMLLGIALIIAVITFLVARRRPNGRRRNGPHP